MLNGERYGLSSEVSGYPAATIVRENDRYFIERTYLDRGTVIDEEITADDADNLMSA